MVAQMVVDYGMPLSHLLARLTDMVGPHAYDRHDIALSRQGYAERREEMYKRLKQDPPAELAGMRVVRIRDDDGFKYVLEDGSWALVRFSGTEPLIRVYSEAPTPDRVAALITALEERLGLHAGAMAVAH